MDTKSCSKCNRKLSVLKFKKRYNRRDTSKTYRSPICQKCSYSNTFWKDANYGERIEKMRELFEKRVIRQRGCWSFRGKPNANGYHVIKVGNKANDSVQDMAAHRISYMIHNGPIPPKMCVCHACDVKICTNPLHLFLGTRADNNIDMHEKGRNDQPKGERNNKAKLTEKQVKEIKQLINCGSRNCDLAKRFNIHTTIIERIKSGKLWKHVKI